MGDNNTLNSVFQGVSNGENHTCPTPLPKVSQALTWGGLLDCCASRVLGLPQVSAGEAQDCGATRSHSSIRTPIPEAVGMDEALHDWSMTLAGLDQQ